VNGSIASVVVADLREGFGFDQRSTAGALAERSTTPSLPASSVRAIVALTMKDAATRPKLQPDLRDEALRILEGHGSLLEVAREVSDLLRAARFRVAIIGGIAVVLHGHLRTTKDVDLVVDGPLKPVVDLLMARGFAFDPGKRELIRRDVPVHLVPREQTGTTSDRFIEIDGITTVTLAELIDMKLRSGMSNILRSQDLADVIGLIRHNRLRSEFSRHLGKATRPEFRRLVRAIDAERRES
jgi:hypothetical protein